MSWTDFCGQPILIATQHGKEQVLGPLLEQGLQLKPSVPSSFNTDQWGTFSGEIPRTHSALDTLRLKGTEAAKAFPDYPFILVSEGSFGPHPVIPFVMADDELLLFYDCIHQREIIQRHISLHTNFNGTIIKEWTALVQFAQQVHFPEHALILKVQTPAGTWMEKGINRWEQLKSAFHRLSQISNQIHVETDMRAHYNPTRMRVIEEAGKLLINKLKTLCSACKAPGFAQTHAIPGLPCAWCAQPTQSTLKAIYSCTVCHHQEEIVFPHQKQTEDPRYCDYCNP